MIIARRVAVPLALVAALSCGCATRTPSAIAPKTPYAERARSGDVVFSEQPTPADLAAFRDAGGDLVVNLRTYREMTERVDYDEKDEARRLGLRYVHLPVTGSTLNVEHVRRLGALLDDRRGGVLLHCAWGGRAIALYTAHLAVNRGLPLDEALERGRAVGLDSAWGEPMATRLAMVTPDEVVAEIDPRRLRRDVDALVSFGTRHTLSDTESDTRGIGAARRWVYDQFLQAAAASDRAGPEQMRVSFDRYEVEADGRRIAETTDVINVVCEIPGASPAARDRHYYVIAHLDSRNSDPNDAEGDAPGANDDASGVALCLELARVLGTKRLDATVVLMATSGEEQGLFGARLHAQRMAREGRNVAAVLSNDMVGDPSGPRGRVDRGHVRVFSEGLSAQAAGDGDRAARYLRVTRTYGSESDGSSRQLARYIHDIAEWHRTAVRPMLIHRPDRFLRGGDHTPFNAAGYPAVRFCEVHEHYGRQHQDVRTEDGVRYGDLPEHVDEDYLADVARLNGAVVVHLANAPGVPRNVRVITAELSDDTTLRWDASEAGGVAGYEIVWRATTSPFWEHAQDVGDAGTGTVDLSKDNWFFGVRAYDEHGYRSPVASPRAARD